MLAIILELLLALVEKICVIVVIAYLITRTKYFMEILNKRFTLKNRVILIVIFGVVSILGTYLGIEVFGAIANVRDLGPMIGGLIGGPLIGVGAGLIGGVHRYFVGDSLVSHVHLPPCLRDYLVVLSIY
jgi:sigma-B regulation protein RsbU (phosphoserine phosphatase)